ncbi:hypothetical protein EV424DRAFT_1330815, partial [Suillus variegatus]
FVEPIDLANDEHHQGWTGFQKVREVVEETKRRGRDKYITDMDIGSSTLKRISMLCTGEGHFRYGNSAGYC